MRAAGYSGKLDLFFRPAVSPGALAIPGCSAILGGVG
jgi:hypothetical protein